MDAKVLQVDQITSVDFLGCLPFIAVSQPSHALYSVAFLTAYIQIGNTYWFDRSKIRQMLLNNQIFKCRKKKGQPSSTIL